MRYSALQAIVAQRATTMPELSSRVELLSALILERNLDLCPVGLDLAVVQLHVQLNHLRDAEVPQTFAGALDCGLGRIFPGLRAGPYEFDNFVNALSHGCLLANMFCLATVR